MGHRLGKHIYFISKEKEKKNAMIYDVTWGQGQQSKFVCFCPPWMLRLSLRGRRLKGKGKGVFKGVKCSGYSPFCGVMLKLRFDWYIVNHEKFFCCIRDQAHARCHPDPIPQPVEVGHTTGFFYVPDEQISVSAHEKGPTVFRPYPRRLESLTICRCHYKGSTFFSVI